MAIHSKTLLPLVGAVALLSCLGLAAPAAAQPATACQERCRAGHQTCLDGDILLPRQCVQILRACLDACEPAPPPPPPPEARLTVRQVLVPGDDSGRFDLRVDGTTELSNAGNGDSTEALTLDTGSHRVSVSAGLNAELEEYAVAVCGACSRDGRLDLGADDGESCAVTALRPSYDIPDCLAFCLTSHDDCLADDFSSPQECVRILRACQRVCSEPLIRRLSVNRFEGTGLSEAEADRILGDASTVWRTSDGTADVACDTAICRDRAVATFDAGNGIVDTRETLNEVFDQPGFVKVVDVLDFCGGANPTIVGCARGGEFVVERIFPAIEGILWAHEYGHTRGLGHRCPTNTEIMCPSLNALRRTIDRSECDAYGGEQISLPAVARFEEERAETALPIEEYVRQWFVHGVPFEEVVRLYDEGDVPPLVAMLRDPAEREHWVNVVVVLGMLGDERAVEPLVAFIEEPAREALAPAAAKARLAALTALGYLVHESGSEAALTYLQEGVEPQAWARRDVGWESRLLPTAAARNRQLSRYAILGLGLSGDPRAEETLRSLLEPAPTTAAEVFRTRSRDAVVAALEANRMIAAEGLEAYSERTSRD